MFRKTQNFNPRSPWGERLLALPSVPLYKQFQSTLPVGGATTVIQPLNLFVNISIHAPRGGSDLKALTPLWQTSNFNPRSPWGERRGSTVKYDIYYQFQSTLPVGGATGRAGGVVLRWPISIHAPRGGSDAVDQFVSADRNISIHAPRGGSDVILVPVRSVYLDFNPRSPWGERRAALTAVLCPLLFQSTLPVGGATFLAVHVIDPLLFQSTLPVGGATSICPPPTAERNFNPRSPWGERPAPCL